MSWKGCKDWMLIHQPLNPCHFRVDADLQGLDGHWCQVLQFLDELQGNTMRHHWTSILKAHFQGSHCWVMYFNLISNPLDRAPQRWSQQPHRYYWFRPFITNDHSCWWQAHWNLFVSCKGHIDLWQVVDSFTFAASSKRMSGTTIQQSTRARLAHFWKPKWPQGGLLDFIQLFLQLLHLVLSDPCGNSLPPWFSTMKAFEHLTGLIQQRLHGILIWGFPTFCNLLTLFRSLRGRLCFLFRTFGSSLRRLGLDLGCLISRTTSSKMIFGTTISTSLLRVQDMTIWAQTTTTTACIREVELARVLFCLDLFFGLSFPSWFLFPLLSFFHLSNSRRNFSNNILLFGLMAHLF